MSKTRRRRAKARQPTQGGMNKTEARYAGLLDQRKRAGEIREWRFEPLKLRLAKATYYTPDFLVVNEAWEIELHEVKGFWRDDARVKIKVAAEHFTEFHFLAVQEVKGGWREERFSASS